MAIAQNYDALVYDPLPQPVTDFRRIFGQACAFGGVRDPNDVLDIGCGTGAQLLQAGEQLSGQLVGTDISAVATGIAREKLAKYGSRVKILCGDLIDVHPDDLGQFDLIYVIGVIYVTPDPVQRKIIELVGRCLRPGGVLQVSYYAGTIPALRAHIHSQLRSAAQDAACREEAISQARARLAQIAEAAGQAQGSDMLRVAIETTQRLPDLIFFHEVLNGAFVPMQTGELEREFSRFGMSFVGYSQPLTTDINSTSRERALLADGEDMAHGQYQFATFAKFDGTGPRVMSKWPVKWQSRLLREHRGNLRGQQTFQVAHSHLEVNVSDHATIAILDALIDGPHDWPALLSAADRAFAATGKTVGPTELNLVQANLCQLWRHGFAFPLFAG